MKQVQNVLLKEYNELRDSYMKAHNEHNFTRMRLNDFVKQVSKLVKWSKDSGVVNLSYGNEVYKVYKVKDKKGFEVFKVMKADRVICEKYVHSMENLRTDIVLGNLTKKR
jgi:hypothetical protein